MVNMLEEIINGWGNLIVRDPDVEKVAIQRAKICAECDELSNGFIGVYLNCKKCGCYIPAKVRCSGEKCKGCPLGKWSV